MEHILYDRIKLQRERNKLIRNISNQDMWPMNKRDLVNKHITHFTQFINSIDFERLILLNKLTTVRIIYY